MKKLFKHLAIVLALALVIGLVPARTAEAADYSLKFKNKYLYVGKKGETAHGIDANGNPASKPIKRSLKFGKGVIEGLKDGDVVTFKSADRTVAKGSKKYQRVFAVGVGETDVAVKVNGEEIGSMHFIVKQNAKSLAVDIPESVGIGDVDVKINVEPADATDIYSIVIPDEYKDIAEVTGKKVDGVTNGVATIAIKTKKPGTFKIQALAQQNDSTLTGFHVKSEEVEVKAALVVEKFAQKSASKVMFDFESDVSKLGLKASDFKVTYKLAGSTVDVSVKGVTVDPDDPSIVYVSIYDENYNDGTTFKAGVEYTVTCNDGKPYTFVGADLSPQFADHIVVNNLTVLYGELVDIDYAVVNADGIELDDEAKTYVTFETASTECAVNNHDKNIIFYEANKQANVTAKFDAWYKDADGKYVEKEFSNTFLFKSVDREAVKYASGEFTIGNDDLEDPIHFLAVNDTSIGNDTDFLFEAKYSDGSKISNAAGNHADFTYKSADTNKLVITATGEIEPIEVGATQILVYDATTASAPLIYVAQVEIKAAAKPTSLATVVDKEKLNTRVGANFVDKIYVSSTVTDQYGRPYVGAEIEYKMANHKDTATFESFAAPNSYYDAGEELYVLEIPANDVGLAGNKGAIIFSARATDGTSYSNVANFSITCKSTTNLDNADNAPVDYASAAAFRLVAIDNIDTTIVDNGTADITADFTTEIKNAPFDEDGYQIGNAFDAMLENDDFTTVGITYRFELFRGATEYIHDDPLNPKYINKIVEDGKVNGVYSLDDGNKVAEKLPKGDYTVRLYKVVVVNNAGKVTFAKTQADYDSFKIKDDQPTVSWTKTKDSIDNVNGAKGYLAADANSLDEAFIVKYDGETLTGADLGKAEFFVTGGNLSANVRDVRYTVEMDGGYKFYVKADVKKTLGYK